MRIMIVDGGRMVARRLWLLTFIRCVLTAVFANESQANDPQRRRAQNRASQRAFRDRKEKHMRELETKLNELSRSYETLQVEYSSVKQELDKLRKETMEGSNSSNPRNYQAKDWEESRREILDPLLFDVSAFCFEQEESDERKQ